MHPNQPRRDSTIPQPTEPRTTPTATAALKRSGIESSNLICAIDLTASNKTSGADTFGGQNLHTLGTPNGNPYEQTMEILGATVSSLDDDGLVPTFGFGDSTSRHNGTLDMGVCQVSQLWDTSSTPFNTP